MTARTLVGRDTERSRLQALLDAARAGRSGALLLHGEAGIGKTALLRWAIEAADGFAVLRARGMESESDIPYACAGTSRCAAARRSPRTSGSCARRSGC